MGKPKALLRLRGRTFIENILDAIGSAGITETIVVLGHYRDQIERAVPPSARTVFNPRYEQGMITSLQTGIRALSPQTIGALLFLVDHPIVDIETIELLLQHAAPNRIVVPAFQGRRGHPVMFSWSVLQEILALSPFQGANIVVHKDPERIVQVPVKSPGILVDVDTPEDFQNLLNAYEAR